MLKIGDFSKLAQVSVKTLRYYGQLGLLKPAWIDRFTGYRYYALEQLPRLNRILALKDLGFSLEQIQDLLHEDLPASELRGMLRLKQAEMERQIAAEQARLDRIAARLQQIEREGELPRYEVVLKTVPPQRVVGVRDVLPGYHAVGGLLDELRAYLRARNVAPDPTCPALAIYYDTEYVDRGIDVEAAAPLIRSLRGTARAVVHSLPGVETMACLVHQGCHSSLDAARSELTAWVEANGYRVDGPNRDIYLQGPEPGLGEEAYVTEVQLPVERKPIWRIATTDEEKKEMEPKIVTKPAFTVVGMLYRGKNENNEVAQMWGEFNPRMREIQHVEHDSPAYGICRDLDEECGFEYLAGFEVARAEDIPAGMMAWDVPEQTYAVFPCTLPTLREAYHYAFETWLPQSGYQKGDGPDFEWYGEEFDPSVADSQMYVYIPIK